MDCVTTQKFWKAFAKLPTEIQALARKNLQLWQQDPAYPSLNFKKIQLSPPIYSLRIGLKWGALGVREKTTIIWFWIGSHEQYNSLISKL